MDEQTEYAICLQRGRTQYACENDRDVRPIAMNRPHQLAK